MSPILVVASALAGGAVGVVVDAITRRVLVGISAGPSVTDVGPAPRGRRRVEMVVVCAALFAAAAVRFDGEWALPAYLVLFAGLVAISVVDLERHVIPNRVVYPTLFAGLALLGGAALLDGDPGQLLRALIGAGAAWAALLCLHLISPGDTGFGDVRLAFLLGLFLGWLGLGHVVLGIFAGFVFGAVIGVGLVVAGVRGRTDPLPLAPFLSAGAVFAIMAGGPVLRLWLG